MFSLEYGVSYREIAEAAGVSYNALNLAMGGRRSGESFVGKVDAYIESYKANHKPLQKLPAQMGEV
ncbi:MAG: hypothetical protein FWF10_11330 [Clostridiales bacterium]|nr:hypothetical protein [Clostridiales bacterium]